ncbi:MAG: hypothetical protein JWL81_2290, partial [Verrucomicrobiales bacterium]|nr:hypothetical protein [Verrucomicrobiales bacterium]
MHRPGLPLLLLFLAAAAPWPGQAQSGPPVPVIPAAPPAPSKLPEYQQATAALRDRLPEVAIVKLRRALDSGKLKPDQALPLRLLLAEALVRADQPDQVLPLTEDPAMAPLPEARFWRAQALARMNRWQDAELLFASLSTLTDFKLATETVFSRAGMLAALGEPDRASRLLVPLRSPAGTPTAQRAGLWLAELRLSAGSPAEAEALLDEIAPPSAGKRPPEQQYLKARIALATPGADRAQTADGLFAVLAAGGPEVPVRLQQAARLGRVRALRAQAKTDEAIPILRQILSGNPTPTPEILDAAFQELETLNHPPSAEMESFLGSLAANADPALKIRARIALAAALETVADSRDATT